MHLVLSGPPPLYFLRPPKIFVEILVHYTCQPVPVTTSTPTPRPPWLLDLSATPSNQWKPKTTPVETFMTTTSSTTSKMTTASTTLESSSTTISTTSIRLETSAVTQKTHNPTSGRTEISIYSSDFIGQSLESDLNLFKNHCHPTNARGLFWNWTQADEIAIQPCPGQNCNENPLKILGKGRLILVP